MAFDLVARVWGSRGLTSTEKLVLLRIADRVNVESGFAYPSVQSLADDCSLTKSGTVKVINRLRAKRCLSVEPGTGRRSSHYRVVVEHLGSGEHGSPLRRSAETCSGEYGSPLADAANGRRPASADVVAVNRIPVAVNGVHRSGEPGSPEALGIRRNQEKRTGADAPDLALSRPAFKVYAAIAREALKLSIRSDGDDSYGNASELFKRMCAQQGVDYGGDVARRALDTAFHQQDRPAAIWSAQQRRKRRAGVA